MKKIILSCAGIFIIGLSIQLTLSSSSQGRAFSANSGNTGAPGEGTTCRSCHGSGFNTTVSISILDSNNLPVSSYIPGEIYNVGFSVNSSGASRYGFQLVALDGTNSPVNGFGVPAVNTRLVTLGGGRQYAEHKGKSTTSAFGTEWTAPASGTGDVTFYGGGAAVNNNGGTSGDGGNITSLVLPENTTVGFVERSLKDDFLIYPNPTKNVVKIENRSENLSNATAQLFDINGKIVLSERIDLKPNQVERLGVSRLKGGMYILKVSNGAKSFEETIIIE